MESLTEHESKTQVWQAALAGLLHDVGKIEPRTRADSEKSPAGDKFLNEIVELADTLSAGERADVTDPPNGNPPNQLVTIFDRLALEPNKARVINYLPLAPLALDQASLFPTHSQDEQTRGTAYDRLRKELEDAVREDSPDPQTYLENMLAAMQRTMWCVPAAYARSVPDVSLYDHSRMTAALAACLANWEPNRVRELLNAVRSGFQNDSQESDAHLDEKVALLIGGDISGVQDFIYTVTSQDAAKTLRGRSFYLQLLTEAVLRFVLRELGLPYTNVIYTGGGNFFLLAPVSAQPELARIRREVTQKLLTHHGSALYLALGVTAVPARGFKRGVFKTHWDRMHREIGKAKQQRYRELDGDLYARVFGRQEHGGNRDKTCGVCGEEIEGTIKRDDETRICPLCDSFATMGRDLTHSDFVALGFSRPQNTTRHDAASALRAFGMQVAFAEAKDHTIAFKTKPERAVVWALDDLERGRRFPAIRDVPTARLTRYTVNRIPYVRDQLEADEINRKLSAADRKEETAVPENPKTFTHLQTQSEGIARLGVLRMDVDNLGELFSRGFGEGDDNLATLARISTLSFQLSLFFDGWVKKICAEHSNLIYAVYTGGDDVFLIAPWSIVPDLARRIVQDLNKYTSNNSDVHVSGGMTFIHGKYPVYQAAEDADEALDNAKAVEGKNAFSFLGRSWKWSEFENVHAKFERLEKMVRARNRQGADGEYGLGAPEALLQTLRDFARMEEAAARGKTKPVWGRWMWLGAYKLTRDADRAHEPLKSELNTLRVELGSNNYVEIAQWGAAARWVQLFVRDKPNE